MYKKRGQKYSIQPIISHFGCVKVVLADGGLWFINGFLTKYTACK